MTARLADVLIAFAAFVVCGCGAADPTPFFDDARYLRFGVDPRVEADAVESQLLRAGFHVDAQAEGPFHVALGFVDSATPRTAIRIVTARGTVLSLDSETNVGTTRRYALLTPTNLRGVSALPEGEVFVREAGERADRTCIAGFRVGSDGALARIVIDAGAVIIDGCASELQDGDADGAIELVVHAAYSAFSIEDPPMVRVPLVAHGGGYRWVSGTSAVTMSLSEQRSQALQDLAAARRELNVDRAYRSAVELAALARFEGQRSGAQLKAFDEALRGLVLTGRQASTVEQARQLIRDGWSSADVTEEVPAAP